MSENECKGVTVLGSTGSIGESTLDVVRRHPNRFDVIALSALRQIDKLHNQCLEFHPRFAVVGEASLAAELQQSLVGTGVNTIVLSGDDALSEIASEPDVDIVMAAIVGAAGLLPTLAAARAGKRLLLANKEALVMSGRLLVETAALHGATLLPIDSEHNAVFQCLPAAQTRQGVRKIHLTASGGPFRGAALRMRRRRKRPLPK